jgi:hypothetical protein
MTEPIRHEASVRNRRKMLKLSRDLLEDLEHLYVQHIKMRNNIEYSIGRARRIINRLEAKPKRGNGGP